MFVKLSVVGSLVAVAGFYWILLSEKQSKTGFSVKNSLLIQIVSFDF